MLARPLPRRDLVVASLATATIVLVTELELLGRYGPSGRTEVAAVVLYAASVWLAVRNSLLTWPVSIVATGLYLWLFWQWKLYADAGLQVAYIALRVAGRWAWSRRRGDATMPEAQRVGPRTAVLVGVGIVVGTAVVREYLLAVGGAAPFWDAALTTGSLGAIYLLVRKCIETWLLWVVLDVAYVALFVSRELYLTAALYLVLLGMAVHAGLTWRALLPDRRQAATA